MASSYDGHASKRQRTDGEGYNMHGGRRESYGDPRSPDPSPVVHVRGLSDVAVESNLIEAVSQFGAVSYVIMMPRKRMALVEFEDLEASTSLVNYSQNNPVFVGGRPAHFNYSTSQKIQRPGGEERGNNVLLFTILNPKYPVTVDVMHTICSNSGTVNRIVIFRKNGLQAMVEFDSIDTAMRAKQSLNGADIYSGCCTLKIEYAKPSRLNVFRNDSDSWDYTNPNLGKEGFGGAPKNQPLLAEPRYGAAPMPYDGPRRGPPPPQQGYQGMDYQPGPEPFDPYGRHDRCPPGPPGHQDRGYGGPPDPYGGPRHDAYAQGYQEGPGHAMHQQGSVLMVYGLNPEKMNCQKVFNLLCLYGNVTRIKFLMSKEGSAMAQMGDNAACERVYKNLNNSFFFDSKLQLGFSKQAFLQDVPNPHELKDGTPSFVDFMGNRNNRFQNPEAASKNRIQPPNKTLHFYNAPLNITEEELTELCKESDVKVPISAKIFPAKEGAKSVTGLIEWESKGDALEALATINHKELPNPNGKHPFIFKLCFSTSSYEPR